MATYYSNVAAVQLTDTTGKLRPTDLGGRVRVIHGVYTASGSEEEGCEVILAKIPQGARLLNISKLCFHVESNCHVYVQARCNENVSNVTSRLVDDGSRPVEITNFDILDTADYIATGETEIFAKFEEGSAPPSAPNFFRFDIFYVVD